MDEQLEAAQPSEASDTDKPKFVGGGYLLMIFVAIGFLFLWMFWLSELSDNFVEAKSSALFNLPWREVPNWIRNVWRVLSIGLPMVLVFGIIIYCGAKLEEANRSVVYAANLKDLSKARVALEQGLRSLDKIEAEYKLKMASYDKLQKQLDELSSIREVDVADLQKKLNAIAIASRHKVWAGRIGLFLAGIATSLLGAFIWDVVAR